MYYLRTQAATQAVQFTIEKKEIVIPVSKGTPEDSEAASERSFCKMEDGCVSCGS
jgi:ribonucleoside-diphosphate reductase alpha chain